MSEYDLQRFVVDLRRTVASVLDRCIKQPSGCWEWQGCRANGYGRVYIPEFHRVVGVHRFMVLAEGREIGGLHVCHHCDNPPCCNPDHLFVGSAADNVRDAMAKHRHVRPPKTDWPSRVAAGVHHWQRLSADDVRAIRSRAATGERQASIAKDFGVSFQAVSKIARGDRWGHLS